MILTYPNLLPTKVSFSLGKELAGHYSGDEEYTETQGDVEPLPFMYLAYLFLDLQNTNEPKCYIH